jgi:hypothetical protein
MNYDKYKTEDIAAEHTLLGRLGIVNETTIASAKKLGKSTAGMVVGGASTVLEVGKVVVPVVAHIASAGTHLALSMRDAASIESTKEHIRGLREIQADLTKKSNLCTCDHCFEVVGYAISQKGTKIVRKQGQIAAHGVSAASPVPLPLGDVITARGLGHTSLKWKAGQLGKDRSRHARFLHAGARGTVSHSKNKPVKFKNGCPVARAIIDELTGHWMRWVFADDGASAIAQRLKSK